MGKKDNRSHMVVTTVLIASIREGLMASRPLPHRT
jgi:hypothetical protein